MLFLGLLYYLYCPFYRTENNRNKKYIKIRFFKKTIFLWKFFSKLRLKTTFKMSIRPAEIIPLILFKLISIILKKERLLKGSLKVILKLMISPPPKKKQINLKIGINHHIKNVTNTIFPIHRIIKLDLLFLNDWSLLCLSSGAPTAS